MMGHNIRSKGVIWKIIPFTPPYLEHCVFMENLTEISPFTVSSSLLIVSSCLLLIVITLNGNCSDVNIFIGSDVYLLHWCSLF